MCGKLNDVNQYMITKTSFSDSWTVSRWLSGQWMCVFESYLWMSYMTLKRSNVLHISLDAVALSLFASIRFLAKFCLYCNLYLLFLRFSLVALLVCSPLKIYIFCRRCNQRLHHFVYLLQRIIRAIIPFYKIKFWKYSP